MENPPFRVEHAGMFDGYVSLPEGCWPFVVNQPHDNWRVLLWIEGVFDSKFDFASRCYIDAECTTDPFSQDGTLKKNLSGAAPLGFKLALGKWVGEIPKIPRRIGDTRFQSAHLTKTRPTFLTKLWKSPLDLQFAPVLFRRSSHVTVTHYLQVICKSFVFDSKTIWSLCGSSFFWKFGI